MFTTFKITWLLALLRGTPLLGPILKGHPVLRFVFEIEGGGEIEINPDVVRSVRVHCG